MKAWLEAHPNVRFHFIPTGASWLNLINAWFGILARRSVRRPPVGEGTHEAHEHYIDHWNESPISFVWTNKTRAEIIRKAGPPWALT